MLQDQFFFALNNLKSRKLRSWLTMLGIFIGIAAVVALIGLGEGLRETINAQFGFLGTDALSITASGGFGPPGTGVVDPLTDKELEEIEKVSGIEVVASRLLESVKMVYNKKASFTFAASMPNGEARDFIEDFVSLEVESGRLLKDGESGLAVLGYNFKEKERFGKPIKVGNKIELSGETFTVVGILEKTGNFQLDDALLINEDDFRELFDVPNDEHDIIAARFDEDSDLEKIKADIEKRLRKVRDVKEGEEDFSVETPASALQDVNTVILGIQIFVYIIAAISILVGGVGIMNTMYTSVVERTKEIGIMKSIGARNSSIFTLFFIESGLLGSVGGIVGIIGGVIAATGIAGIGKAVLGSDLISAHISLSLLIGALLFSFLLGSFFGTLPAYQASKLNPVEALRGSK
ncbi:ABC transporter permease [Nanoarchaeota archaeon]